MSSQPAEPTTSRHRVAFAIGIVILSIVLPVVVVGWSVLAEMRDKGISYAPSARQRTHYGSIRKGELWHAETRLSPIPFAPPIETRILRRDLKTGVERDTGLVVPNDYACPLWIGDELYVQSLSVLYQSVDNTLVKLAALPTSSGTFQASLFLWEGRLTTIRQNGDGSYRLIHLSSGQWIDGRPILLPEPGRVFYDDQQRNRRVLLPRTSQQPASQISPTVPTTTRLVNVVQHDQQWHLMVSDYGLFGAYRTGFVFADESDEGASALAPENAIRDVSGWESIGPSKQDEPRAWSQMASGRDGILCNSWRNPQTVAHRNWDGTWHEQTLFQNGDPLQRSNLMSDPADSTAYLIKFNQEWGSAEVRRVEGNTVYPVHLTIPGCEREYLARWRRIGMSLLIAWMLHIVVLIGGAAWLTHGVVSPSYEFGNRRVTLAPSWRRALATSFDVALLVVFASLLGRSLFNGLGIFSGIGIQASDFNESSVAHGLYYVEQHLTISTFAFGGPATDPGFWLAIPRLLHRIDDFPDLIGYFGAMLFFACGVKVLVEGRYGITPGKWLLGLRTVRTTLRPCGFARGLVRNVLYYVDLPLLLTPLPAAVSLMFSDHRQRLGDRVADTIVVRAGSMREAG